MKTIKILLVFLLILFYLFLNYTPLVLEWYFDKKLDNGESVTSLARDVAKNASCTLSTDELVETTSDDVHHQLMCENKIKNIHFVINVFTTEIAKNEFLREDEKSRLYFQKTFGKYYNPKYDRNVRRAIPAFYAPCFKQGKYYVVCEDVRWNLRTGIPIFNGEAYYHEFKGTDIDWKIH